MCLESSCVRFAFCNCQTSLLNVFQEPDTESPPLPPDVFGDKNGMESCPANIVAARARFKSELCTSPSVTKKGCHCYVSSDALHEKIPDGALVLSPENKGKYDIMAGCCCPKTKTKPRVGAIPDPSEYDDVEKGTTQSAGKNNRLSMVKRKRSLEDTKPAWTWFVERESIVKVQFLWVDKSTLSDMCLEDVTTLGVGLVGVTNGSSSIATPRRFDREKVIMFYKCPLFPYN